MSISRGVHRLPSRIGVLLTLLTSVILIGYTVFKMSIMVNRRDNVMMSTTNDFYYDSDYVMDRSKYFNFAVALTAFDNVRENILDPSLAQVKFYAEEWEIDAEQNLINNMNIPIEPHICSREELGLTGANSQFLPSTRSAVIAEVERYQQKFMCLEEKDMKIYGDYNSNRARQIQVRLEKCHDQAYCKSDEVIDRFLEDKYILLLTNQIRYDAQEYGD